MVMEDRRGDGREDRRQKTEEKMEDDRCRDGETNGGGRDSLLSGRGEGRSEGDTGHRIRGAIGRGRRGSQFTGEKKGQSREQGEEQSVE